MTASKSFRTRIAESHFVWKLYHLFVADAVSLQKPTKYKIIYSFLGGNLGRAADIGCGPGVFIRHLSKRASKVFAADIDAAALQRVKARNRGVTNLECVVTLANHLPFTDSSLDTVLLLEVLEHLEDDAAGVREVCRVLASGGKLVLSVPVPPGEINEGDPWGHKREGYQLDQIRSLVESNGFLVLDYGFAQFKFSRLAEKMVQRWRRWFHLPAPIFLSWLGYLDHLLGSEGRRRGDYHPSTVVVMARKKEDAWVR
ncbi:MAG: class I SAM-dependent methyltransferase [Candidatus Acidiferrales bacterium]